MIAQIFNNNNFLYVTIVLCLVLSGSTPLLAQSGSAPPFQLLTAYEQAVMQHPDDKDLINNVCAYRIPGWGGEDIDDPDGSCLCTYENMPSDQLGILADTDCYLEEFRRCRQSGKYSPRTCDIRACLRGYNCLAHELRQRGQADTTVLWVFEN